MAGIQQGWEYSWFDSLNSQPFAVLFRSYDWSPHAKHRTLLESLQGEIEEDEGSSPECASKFNGSC